MYEVDRNSRPPRLHYPHGSFSARPDLQRMRYRGSLGRTFVLGNLIVKFPIRLPFALTLYSRFLTGMRKPLGTLDNLSRVYRPSQTAHLLLSPMRGKQHRGDRVVLHRCLPQDLRPECDAPTYAIRSPLCHNNKMQ